MVKAEGSDTIEDLNVYGCWNHLKPNHESAQGNCINIQNCNRIIINELDGKKNFQSSKTLYLSLLTSFKDCNMKIKSLMKVKEVRKVQIHGVSTTNPDEDDHNDNDVQSGVQLTKKARDYLELRNQIKDYMNDVEARNEIIYQM